MVTRTYSLKDYRLGMNLQPTLVLRRQRSHEETAHVMAGNLDKEDRMGAVVVRKLDVQERKAPSTKKSTLETQCREVRVSACVSRTIRARSLKSESYGLCHIRVLLSPFKSCSMPVLELLKLQGVVSFKPSIPRLSNRKSNEDIAWTKKERWKIGVRLSN